jgi:hypothetical protein
MTKSKRLILKVEIGMEILNEENFNDFNEEKQRKFLIQEMLDESTWPGEGIGCEVISSTIENID